MDFCVFLDWPRIRSKWKNGTWNIGEGQERNVVVSCRCFKVLAAFGDTQVLHGVLGELMTEDERNCGGLLLGLCNTEKQAIHPWGPSMAPLPTLLPGALPPPPPSPRDLYMFAAPKEALVLHLPWLPSNPFLSIGKSMQTF